MDRTIENLENSIVSDLTLELSGEESFSAEKLTAKVKNAIREVREHRSYGFSSLNEQQIEDDLWNYYSTISRVALYDYNQIGAEYEKSHSENGISRSYVDRPSLFNGVSAFVKLL